jgi:hypothetical protein
VARARERPRLLTDLLPEPAALIEDVTIDATRRITANIVA